MQNLKPFSYIISKFTSLKKFKENSFFKKSTELKSSLKISFENPDFLYILKKTESIMNYVNIITSCN